MPPDDLVVYKILAAADWREAVAARAYEGSPDDRRDGFIHLSTRSQVAGTAARHFKEQAGLVLVALDVARLGSALKWEPSRGGELFPHLYGPLDPAAAIDVTAMPLDAQGIPQASGAKPS